MKKPAEHQRDDAPLPHPRRRAGRWLLLLLGIILGLLLAMLWEIADSQPSQAGNTQPSQAAETAVRVIDGDTLVLAGDAGRPSGSGTTYRLWGIDAPELNQLCADGWPAGAKARGFLRLLVEGLAVTCDDRGADKYGRTLSVCTAGQTSLGQAMVRAGHAWAYTKYSRDYLPDEWRARSVKAGVHAHGCLPPWDYRHGKAGK